MVDKRDALAACNQQHPQQALAAIAALQPEVERHRCQRLWPNWRAELNPMQAPKSAADADVTESWPGSKLASNSDSGSRANDSSSAAARRQQPAVRMTTAEREQAVAEVKEKLARAKAKKQQKQAQKQQQAKSHTEPAAQNPTRRSTTGLAPPTGAVAVRSSQTRNATAEQRAATAGQPEATGERRPSRTVPPAPYAPPMKQPETQPQAASAEPGGAASVSKRKAEDAVPHQQRQAQRQRLAVPGRAVQLPQQACNGTPLSPEMQNFLRTRRQDHAAAAARSSAAAQQQAQAQQRQQQQQQQHASLQHTRRTMASHGYCSHDANAAGEGTPLLHGAEWRQQPQAPQKRGMFRHCTDLLKGVWKKVFEG